MYMYSYECRLVGLVIQGTYHLVMSIFCDKQEPRSFPRMGREEKEHKSEI